MKTPVQHQPPRSDASDSSFILRELLQNALDALELRDLRLKMLARGETPHEKIDPLPSSEALQVILTWGHDATSGQEYLLVEDNGVGMTEDVITRFFTQVGKSYYRSPDYHRERALLRNANLITSPISIFGIGILSCFMIADRLEVRTCPGGANDTDRAPRDITISGPGSLFWLRPAAERISSRKAMESPITSSILGRKRPDPPRPSLRRR